MMRLIRLKEVISITGLSRSTVYKFIEEGSFPKQIPLGDRAVAWVENEIEEWVLAKVEVRGIALDNKLVTATTTVNEADVVDFIKRKFQQCSVSDAIAWLISVIT